MANKESEKLWTPLFISTVAVALCCFLVAQGMNSGTSVYLEQLGETTALAGGMAIAFSVSAAIARILSGPLVDKHSPFRVLIVGCIILSVGTLAGIFSSNSVLVACCRVLQGIGFSAATTAASTLAAAVLPRSRVGEGLGYYGLGQALAMSIGPALALYLVSTNPSTNLFLGIGAVALLAVVGAVVCFLERKSNRVPKSSAYYRRQHPELDEGQARRAATAMQSAKGKAVEGKAIPAAVTKKGQVAVRGDAGVGSSSANKCAKDSGPQGSATVTAATVKEKPAAPKQHKLGFLHILFEPAALPGALPQFLLAANVGFGIYFVGLYGEKLGIPGAGMFFTVSAISMIGVRVTSHFYMDKIKPIILFGFAVVTGLITYALLLACPESHVLYYVAGFFYGLCLGLGLPLNQSIAVKCSPMNRWGSANALFLLSNDLGIGVSAVVWGFTNNAFGFAPTIVMVMVCIVASFIVARIVYPGRKSSRKKA